LNILITLILAFLITGAVMAVMSIGVIAGRAPIKGSCGGLNGGSCELCSGNCKRSADNDQEIT
jgi:hypothetical protein